MSCSSGARDTHIVPRSDSPNLSPMSRHADTPAAPSDNAADQALTIARRLGPESDSLVKLAHAHGETCLHGVQLTAHSMAAAQMLYKPLLQQHLVVAEAPRERASIATVQQALGMAAL